MYNILKLVVFLLLNGILDLLHVFEHRCFFEHHQEVEVDVDGEAQLVDGVGQVDGLFKAH